MFRRFTIVVLFGSFFILAVTSARAASSVVINEIQTGGTDADDEFIELWNGSDATLALDDWSVQYKTATGTTITKRNFEKGAAIPAQGFYLIATKVYTGSVAPDLTQSSIGLAKSGGNVFLVRNQDVVTSKDDPDIVDRVAWGTGDSAEGSVATTPDGGQSIERTDGADTNNNAKDFALRATPTPANTKTVTATETSAAAPASSPASGSTPADTSTKKESASATKEEKGTLSITEILPNPVGSDESEFIELQNTGTVSLPLADWRITNRLEQEYVLKEGTLGAKEYRLLSREKTGLALQNDREELKLFAPNKDRATETVKYTDAPEGLSLMRNVDDDLVWTTTPSPGEANRLVEKRRAPRVMLRSLKEGNVGELLSFDGSDSFDPEGSTLTFRWDFGDKLGKGESSQASYIYFQPGTFTITLTAADKEGLTTSETQKIKISGENLLAVPVIAKNHTPLLIEEGRVRSSATQATIRDSDSVALTSHNNKKPLASGTIRGVVTVPPGVLAKTYMYIACETPCAGQGVKIRMTKADWPDMKKGDVITVAGKASTTGGEQSFLTRKEAVHVMGSRKNIAPLAVGSSELTDALVSQLVTLTGEVAEKKSGMLYLSDGAGEIPVQVKSSARLIAEGDNVAVTGILTKNENGYLLKASEPIEVTNTATKKAGEPLKIVRDAKSERTKYLVTTLAALLAIAARPTFLFVQKRRKKLEGLEG